MPSRQNLTRALFGKLKSGLESRRLPIFLALLSPLLLAPALSAGWQLDDHFQRSALLGYAGPPIQLFVFYDGDPETIRQNMEAGLVPWWTAPTLRHANFRYLSVLTMMLDYLLWPETPALMHLHSLLWLAVLVAAATSLYRRIMGAVWAAGLAALLYALDDAHSLPTAYLANRNALIAMTMGILSVLSFARWREDDWRPGRTLSPIFFALALSAGEIALGTAGYLFAYALFMDRGTKWERLIALVPCGAVLVLWALIYKFGGYGSEGSGFYLDPLRDPLAFGSAFISRTGALLMGQWTPIPADILASVSPGSEAAQRWGVIALIVVGLLALLFVPLLRRDPESRFWCLGALLSLVPVAATGPQNRLLFFVGLGSMGLFAQVCRGLVEGFPALPSARWWRIFAWAMTIALLVVHVPMAPIGGLATLDFQDSVSNRMNRAIESVPNDPQIAEQDLVLINPPEHVYLVTAIVPVKLLEGSPIPRRLRALASGSSAMEVTRIDPRTLKLNLAAGLFPDPFSRYYRSDDLPMSVGERFELGGMTVEVLGLNEVGDPDELLYHFAAPLEDASLRWLQWKDGVYIPWTPPAVGNSEQMDAAYGIFY